MKQLLSENLIKYLSLYGNIILLFFSIGSLIRCAIVYAQFKKYDFVIESPGINLIPLIGIAVLVTMIFLVCYGLVALYSYGFGLIAIYVVGLILLAMITFALSMTVIFQVKEMAKDPFYFLNIFSQAPNITRNIDAIPSIDALQIDFQCCGLTQGPTQYKNEHNLVPSSCCRDPETCDSNEIWMDSCHTKLKRYCLGVYSWVGYTLVGSTCLLFTNAAVAYLHAVAIRQFYYY